MIILSCLTNLTLNYFPDELALFRWWAGPVQDESAEEPAYNINCLSLVFIFSRWVGPVADELVEWMAHNILMFLSFNFMLMSWHFSKRADPFQTSREKSQPTILIVNLFYVFFIWAGPFPDELAMFRTTRLGSRPTLFSMCMFFWCCLIVVESVETFYCCLWFVSMSPCPHWWSEIYLFIYSFI